MPKDENQAKLANTGKALATLHAFSTDDRERLEKALRASAKTIAPNPIGKERNALYASHKDQIFAEFRGQWDWSKTTQKVTMASIRKILSNYLFAFNESKSTPKAVPKRKKGKKTDLLKPDLSQPKHVVPFIKKEDSPVRPSLARPRGLGSPFGFTPINQKLPSPSDHLVGRFSESPFDKPSDMPSDQLFGRFVESPFDKPSKSPIDSILQSTEHSIVESEAQSMPKLSEIIVVVRPSSSDPWGRPLLSFPLWRCQTAVDGRDAAPESLQDWRDLSFADFLRQLKSEQVLTSEESVVWGQFNQVVTSDMTFAGAVQEQLQAAVYNGSAENEATFMVISSKSHIPPPEQYELLTSRQNPRR
jgi:hypothetical protein